MGQWWVTSGLWATSLLQTLQCWGYAVLGGTFLIGGPTIPVPLCREQCPDLPKACVPDAAESAWCFQREDLALGL